LKPNLVSTSLRPYLKENNSQLKNQSGNKSLFTLRITQNKYTVRAKVPPAKYHPFLAHPAKFTLHNLKNNYTRCDGIA
jgi:hypothetical protein